MKYSACIATFLINVLAFQLFVGSAYASLIRRPDSTTLLVGSQLRLNCSTNYPGVTWNYVQPGISYVMLYSGRQMFSSRYHVDNASLHDLTANVSDVAYCGTYTCYDNSGVYSTENASAEVQVATKPECTVNDTEPRSNDSVSITCSMSYCNMSVDAPKFTSVNRLNATFSVDHQSYFIANLSVVNHTATLTGSALSLNGATIVYIYSPVPESSTKCPIVIVHYHARNVRTSPQRTTYSNGDIISCSADGVPIPAIYWTDDMNNIVSNSSVLVVSGTVGSNYTFQCVATNVIKRTHYIASDRISFTVVNDSQSLSTTNSVVSKTDSFADSSSSRTSASGSGHVTTTTTSSSSSSSNIGAIIGGVIGGCFGILIIVIIIVLVICCFTKRKDNERKKTSSMATLPIVQPERDKESTFIESESPRKYSPGYEDVDGIPAHQTDAPDILRTNETNRNNGQSVKSLYPKDDDEQDDTKTDEQTMMYAELQTNKKPPIVAPTESPAPVVVTENQTYAAIDHRPQNAG